MPERPRLPMDRNEPPARSSPLYGTIIRSLDSQVPASTVFAFASCSPIDGGQPPSHLIRCRVHRPTRQLGKTSKKKQVRITRDEGRRPEAACGSAWLFGNCPWDGRCTSAAKTWSTRPGASGKRNQSNQTKTCIASTLALDVRFSSAGFFSQPVKTGNVAFWFFFAP